MKKAWLWTKLHWKYLLAGIVALFSLVFAVGSASKASTLLNSLNREALQHKEDLAKLEQIQKENEQRQQRIEATYRETLARVAAQRQQELLNIDNATKDQVKSIVEQTHDDPTEMARQLNTLLGLPIVVASGA
jgi:TolA-binding protein